MITVKELKENGERRDGCCIEFIFQRAVPV